MKTAAALIVSAMVAACGGGDDRAEPVTLIDQTATTSGSLSVGQSVSAWDARIDGPGFKVAATGKVTMCVDGSWSQELTKSTSLTLKLTMLAPLQGGAPTTTAVAGTVGGQNNLALRQCQTINATAGSNYLLQMRAFVTTDCGCLDALGAYIVTIRWVVTAE